MKLIAPDDLKIGKWYCTHRVNPYWEELVVFKIPEPNNYNYNTNNLIDGQFTIYCKYLELNISENNIVSFTTKYYDFKCIQKVTYVRKDTIFEMTDEEIIEHVVLETI